MDRRVRLLSTAGPRRSRPEGRDPVAEPFSGPSNDPEARLDNRSARLRWAAQDARRDETTTAPPAKPRAPWATFTNDLVRILIVAEVRLYREGLALILDAEPNLKVTAAASTA